MRLFVVLLFNSLLLAAPTWAEQPTIDQCLGSMQRIGPKGQGHPEAIEAWKVLAASSASQLPEILAGMKDDHPLANNWIRGAIDTIAQRTLQSGRQLPVVQLERYIADTSHSPRSRRLAFEWVTRVDGSARDRIVPTLLNDPGLELRREAVAVELKKAKDAADKGRKREAIQLYKKSLNAARDLDQIESATKQLRELGQDVHLPTQFGFVMTWHLIAPFDNTDTSGFDKTYPPEKGIQLDASYDGKDGPVKWIKHSTDDEYGLVDLNKALGKHKGSVAYAMAEFVSNEARPIELRLGCINANKVWLNGDLLTSNHVYHAGRGIDQYAAGGQLRQGKNVILLKICQNEQTEPWAQDWQFQLRVCDEIGTAVLSSGRLVTR